MLSSTLSGGPGTWTRGILPTDSALQTVNLNESWVRRDQWKEPDTSLKYVDRSPVGC